ncbi:MAG: hypothetical protein ABFR82_00010 [Nitrospirota bacterium]
MKISTFMILSIILTCIVFAYTAGAEKEAEAPSYGSLDIHSGLALFNDKNLGNGTAGKSCDSCHPNGRGLEAAGNKKEFNIFGKKQNSLQEAVNFCIVNPLKGTAIDPDSQDMKNIVSYIKSLKK